MTPAATVTVPYTTFVWLLVQVSSLVIVPEYQAAVLLTMTCWVACPITLPEASRKTTQISYCPSGTAMVFQAKVPIAGWATASGNASPGGTA